MSKNKPPLISLIIPVYNEEASIYRALTNVVQVDFGKCVVELIVVNDGSKDKSEKIIKQFIKNHPQVNILMLKHKANQGKGAAIKTGLTKVRGKYVVIQDGDLEYDPEDIKVLIDYMLQNQNAHCIYGSRILGKRIYKNYSANFVFYCGGIALTHLVNYCFRTHLTDQATCYKIFKAELIPMVLQNSKYNGFDFEVELTYLLTKQGKIMEKPIRYYPRNRKYGKKINFKDFLKSLVVIKDCMTR